MTASTDTFVDSFVENAQRTREAVAGAVTEAVRSWAGAVAGLASGRPSVPDAQVVVDRWFDIAQTVLDTQKAFAKSVAGAGAHAVEVYTEQARRRPRPWRGSPRTRGRGERGRPGRRPAGHIRRARHARLRAEELTQTPVAVAAATATACTQPTRSRAASRR